MSFNGLTLHIWQPLLHFPRKWGLCSFKEKIGLREGPCFVSWKKVLLGGALSFLLWSTQQLFSSVLHSWASNSFSYLGAWYIMNQWDDESGFSHEQCGLMVFHHIPVWSAESGSSMALIQVQELYHLQWQGEMLSLGPGKRQEIRVCLLLCRLLILI